jgi:tetratricopeptide (TPR) repeat protein
MRRILAAALIVAAALLLIHQWALVPWQCNRLLYPMRLRSYALLGRVRDPLVAIPAARETIEMASRCAARCPEQIDWLLMTAASYHVMGQYDRAEATYRAALRVDQRPEIYRDLGFTQLDARQFDDAIVSLAVAFRFSSMAFIEDIPEQYRPAVQAKAEDTVLILDVLRRRGAARRP